MQRRRIYFLVLILVLLFSGIASRLVWLQFHLGHSYQVQAEITRRTIQYISPVRGSILDRHGEPLAEEAPCHDLVYTLKEVERARSVARAVTRTLLAHLDQPAMGFSEDYLHFRLQGIRTRVRPGLADETPLAPELWLPRVPLRAAKALAARINRRPDDFTGTRVEILDGFGRLWVDPSRMFAGERAARRVAERLAFEDPTAHYSETIWAPYLAARREPNRTARQWAFEEERVLARHIPFDLVVDVTHHPNQYPGLRVRASTRRRYPGGRTLAQLVGYLGAPSKKKEEWRADQKLLRRYAGINDIRTFLALRSVSYLGQSKVGLMGLERLLEERLRGKPGARIFEVDRFRRESGTALEEAPMIPGEDFRLTLDLEFCRATEEILTRHGVEAGSALVGDPNSGEILGWCSLPSFDLGDRKSWDFDRPNSPFLSRPQIAIPPGTTFKPVLAAGALQEGVVSPHEIITCTGYFDPQHRNHLRCPNHGFAIVDIDLRQSISRSCNYFYYELGKRRLGKGGVRRWASIFGFGRPTGVGLSERSGSIHVRHAESASIGKGGITCTPLQLLRYSMALANRGHLPALRVIEGWPRSGAEDLPIDAHVWPPVLEGMRDAVRRHHGTAAKPEIGLTAFDCAVKTGTAGIPGKELNIAWIVGFAPFHDPTVAFVVAIENTPLHGGDAAGPVATELLAWLTEHRGYDLEWKEGTR